MGRAAVRQPGGMILVSLSPEAVRWKIRGFNGATGGVMVPFFVLEDEYCHGSVK